MKRSLSLLIILVFCAMSNASVTTFDDNPLVPESYWGGAGSSETGFVSGGVNFIHNDGGWSWDGFVYSNMTDTTTAGYENQFSAYTGGGAEGSSNYAISALGFDWSIYQILPVSIVFENVSLVQGGYFTNTTYAYLAMKNGEGPATKFDDGDWFKLSITGKDASGSQTGTIDFYLAAEGQIVSTWEYVSLSGLGEVKSLEFLLSSSDTGMFGMNTPAYFAMDNLVVPEPATLTLIGLSGLIASLKRRR